MSELLTGEGIGFSYGEKPTLSDVKLTVLPGEMVALLGPNGSGKSTLLKVLLGYLRGTGVVQWQGREMSVWRRRELARVVAYLPQTATWEVGQSVIDALRLGRAPYWGALGIESAGDEKIIRSVAKTLELDDLLSRRMDELSGGQRQRVLLGRCLVQEPKAMLLDEPSTYLDIRHQIELCQLLRKLAAESEIGFLMAWHDLNLAGMFADRVIVLRDGKVAATGTANEVLRPELISEVYGVAMERIERAGKGGVLVPKVN
jgi:iron complex transport system ATP-binding protein